MTFQFNFSNVVPSDGETSFQPLFMVCISIIIHIAHYILEILNISFIQIKKRLVILTESIWPKFGYNMTEK